jgi:ABC-type sugar transport system substrate-binding protein
LLAGKSIDAVAANNDEMGIGAAMALRQAKNDKILVGGIDGTPDGLVAIARKQLAVTVLRDPVAMGNAAVEAAVKLAHKETLQGDIWIPLHLVTFDNHTEFERR